MSKAADELVVAVIQVTAAYFAAKATVHAVQGANMNSEAVAWHRIMKFCNGAAEIFGRAGMYAESKYWKSVRT